MTIRELASQWILSSLLISAGIFIVACSDSDSAASTSPSTGTAAPTADASSSSSSGADASSASPSASAGDASAGLQTACLGNAYGALSDGCRTCVCNVDPQLAPSCQKPCWDFLACSSAAQVGACASSAAGGDAKRPEFNACIMEQCGAQLAVPGAEVVASYRTIIGSCAVSMGSVMSACADDISRFQSGLKKP